MAHAATQDAPHHNFLLDLIYGLGRGLVAIGENNARVREMERLQALSDDQLAARGLTRETIVRHVFRDVFYA